MNFFEKLMEWFYMISIALSPVLLGVAIGGYFYLTATTVGQEVLGISIAASGLILGVVFVIYVKRKHTATHFMSRIMATPELDKKSEEKK